MRRVLVALLVACGQMDSSTPPTNVTYTFAMKQLFIDVRRDTTGWPYPGAWRDYGTNLDGKVTDATSTDVCTLYPNGSQVDGTNGIDNAFGAVLVPNMEPEQGSFSDDATFSIQHGAWTLQFQVVGLSNDPVQTSSGLVARVFASAAYPGTPAFDETTSWPVASTSLADGATIEGGAIATFPNATITNGRFDSGPATGPLRFTMTPDRELVVHDVRVTFQHTSRVDALEGTLSGVLDVQELIDTEKAIASNISPSLCSNFDAITTQARAAADILHDGTNASGVPCDGISIGFGFDARLVANPTAVMHVDPVVDVCPP